MNAVVAPVALPDLAVANQFLTLIAEGEQVTFQTFDDSPAKNRALAEIIHGCLDDCAQRLMSLNARGAGVFWMVNFGDGAGREIRNVTGVRALFLDLDGAPLEPVLAAGLEPHAIVESSPGKWHVYWLVSGCDLEQFKPAQRALAARFGGDPSVCDLPRVLRVPGFLHRKGEPFVSRVAASAPLQPYRFEDLWRSFGLIAQQAPKVQRVDPVTGELRAKVAPGGRHAHLVKWASALNWRGIPPAAIAVALHEKNAADCDPPKTREEVEAIAIDICRRYAVQHGREYAGNTTEQTGQKAPADPLAALARFIVTDEQVQAMKATRMIWRDVIAQSHVSVWAAPGNGGKTTLARLAAAELAADGFDVLFFQEDASAGDLPMLHQHAKESGYRMLNSTLAGSVPEDQLDVLHDLAQSGADLSNVVLILDTLKKYADLMNKRGSRAFFQLMRALTQRGATVVLLGHTNKHRGPDGKLMFEGVGDVRNDVDEMIYIEATSKDPEGRVLLTMQPDKVRCQVRECTFELDTMTMIVRPKDEVVDVAELCRRADQRDKDEEVIAAVRDALQAGGKPKFKLVAEVVAATGIGDRTVRAVVNRYMGTDPRDTSALWLETRFRMNNTVHVSLKPAL